jgi:Cysteine dioxygenase type I
MTVPLRNEPALAGIDAWASEFIVGGSPASPEGLRELASAIGRSPRLWGEGISFDAAGIAHRVIRTLPEVEIALFGWAGGQETVYHDHGGASGAVFVCTGHLVETTIEVRDGKLVRERSFSRRADSSFGFGPSYIHRVRHDPEFGVALSIHAYGRADGTQIDYEVLEDGTVRALDPRR